MLSKDSKHIEMPALIFLAYHFHSSCLCVVSYAFQYNTIQRGFIGMTTFKTSISKAFRTRRYFLQYVGLLSNDIRGE